MGCPINRLLATMVVAVLASGNAAEANTVLTLSDHSSDETSAAALDATLVFSVVGTALDLTVANDTPEVGGFDIKAVYFNATSNVSGLLLGPGANGWHLFPGESADGFGTFDFALISDAGGDPAAIDPQESLTFTFDIMGVDPFLEVDFVTEFSDIPPGDTRALAAAKFVRGPGDDSAFGAVIPEPGTAMLGIFGIGVLGWIKRRAR